MNKLIAGVILLCALPCISQAQEGMQASDDEMVNDEVRAIAVSEVPKEVMDAVNAHQPGIYFTRAERLWLNDMEAYQLVGRQFSDLWDFLVYPDGTIISVNRDRQKN